MSQRVQTTKQKQKRVVENVPSRQARKGCGSEDDGERGVEGVNSPEVKDRPSKVEDRPFPGRQRRRRGV